jgi:hypothetical protein
MEDEYQVLPSKTDDCSRYPLVSVARIQIASGGLD